MASIFSKIVKGEIPSYKIAEDARFYAFLDIRPVQKGHCLVIPKTEVDYIFDLPSEEAGALFCFAQKVAKALKMVVPCQRVGVMVIGMEVPHAHIHLIPINQEQDMDLSRPRCEMTPEAFMALASQVLHAYNTLEG